MRSNNDNISVCFFGLLIVHLLSSTIKAVKPCMEEPDYEKLQFGNILREKEESVQQSNNDVKEAISRALEFLKRDLKLAVAATPVVSDLSKVNLVFTADDSQATPVPSEDIISAKQDPLSILSFGFLYFFTLSWPSSEDRTDFHKFVISRYKSDYFVYAHTFWTELSSCSRKTKSSDTHQKYLRDSNTESVQHVQTDQSKTSTQDAAESTTKQQCLEQPLATSKEECRAAESTKCSLDFSIMTYNIWNTNAKPKYSEESYKARIQHLGKVVLDSNPDIVCFQEVRFQAARGGDLGPSQTEHLYKMLQGYTQFVFIPAQLQGNSLDQGRTEEGLAIFSKFPIVSYQHILLFRNRSNSADTHQRILLHARIQLPTGVILNVLNTHFSLSHEARERKVVQVWRYIQRLEGPLVFVGDFNEFPFRPPMKFLRGEETLEGVKCQGLVDVWSELKHDVPGFTYCSLDPEAMERIDYIYYRKSEKLSVKDITIVDDGLRGDKAASDHFPLKAVFTVSS